MIPTPRYQECGLLVRLWRRQWKIWYTFVFIWWVTKWFVRGMHTPLGHTRRYEVTCMWHVSRGMADIRMSHVYTLEEARERYKPPLKVELFREP